MDKQIIRMTPDDFGYKDRGKMKWMGLMLSDHLDALREIDKEEKKGKPIGKEVMSEFEIAEILHIAYVNKSPIIIQADVMTNGHFYPDLECIVLGYQDAKIYLKLKDGRQTNCELHQIRNVEYMNPFEWYDKMQ